MVAAFGFFVSGAMGDPDFLAVLALILAALLLLHFVPITREPRLAREVLRRWDRLRVERVEELHLRAGGGA